MTDISSGFTDQSQNIRKHVDIQFPSHYTAIEVVSGTILHDPYTSLFALVVNENLLVFLKLEGFTDEYGDN